METNMNPAIILIMKEPGFEPISFVEDLCECNDDGTVKIFPNLNSAANYRDDHAIDGRVVELPIY